MRKILTALLLVATLTSVAQERVISTQDGFEIKYTSKKLSEGSKDKYLITVTAINRNAYPLFYGVATTNNNGTVTVNALLNQYSEKVTVRNATGFLASDGVKIKGELLDLFTEGKAQQLYKYDADKPYNYENEINVKHGDTPIITVTHTYSLKPLSRFNIEASAAMLDGTYKNGCGNTTFSIAVQTNQAVTVLVQTVNGKQVRWIKNSATSFTKENDPNSTLSYNKEKNSFLYSNADGVSCEWSKL